jgi:DNA polymerase III epsilon subunit-like protein
VAAAAAAPKKQALYQQLFGNADEPFYLAFDIETSSSNVFSGSIISLAAVVCGEPVADMPSFSELIRPDEGCDQFNSFAIDIHRITSDMVRL